MEHTKRDYLFRYADEMGSLIRSTFMQCPADIIAVERARSIMQDRYASLEILTANVSSIPSAGRAPRSRWPRPLPSPACGG
jgi:hypothetical protein